MLPQGKIGRESHGSGGKHTELVPWSKNWSVVKEKLICYSAEFHFKFIQTINRKDCALNILLQKPTQISKVSDDTFVIIESYAIVWFDLKENNDKEGLSDAFWDTAQLRLNAITAAPLFSLVLQGMARFRL